MILYLVLTFAIAIVVLLLFNSLINRAECIECVDAGPSKEVNINELNKGCRVAPMGVFRTPDNKVVTSSQFRRVSVKGNCMKPRGIHSGQELLVEKMRDDLSVHPNDILLIYLDDKKIFKLRVLESITPEGDYNTYYFDDEGKTKASTKPHKPESVKGVVRYIIPSEYA